MIFINCLLHFRKTQAISSPVGDMEVSSRKREAVKEYGTDKILNYNEYLFLHRWLNFFISFPFKRGEIYRVLAGTI